MKIYFSPDYASRVYVVPEAGEVMMDTAVMGTTALVAHLELRLGIHHPEVADSRRTARYYTAMNRYLKAHPESVLTASFQTAPLATAKAVLKWRDTLRMAGWTGDGADVSRRMAALAGIEEEYDHEGETDLAARLQTVTQRIADVHLDVHDTTIAMPCATSALPHAGLLAKVPMC